MESIKVGEQLYYVAEERMYLTADKSELVPEGDEKAAFLYATPGTRIPEAAAVKFGLELPRPEPKPRPRPKPLKKAVKKSADKAIKQSKNK
ncbi:hypothetical protein MYX75_01020 [Acidobacteria bacterium AH-259-A15]|nr:hypothetical protein [Acidobacteria bacterium AH-259-A15]